jgi:DNA-binding transcriptional LysR family regulator
MRLTQIRDFLAVVECSGVRAAARKLGVAQPTVSKSVRELESELHVQLLGRNSRGVVLTPAGRAFHARAQAVATELHKAREEAAQTGGSGAGTVTCSMGPVGVISVLPEALTRFRRQFPLARVHVVEGYGHLMLSDVRSEKLDFAFGLKPIQPLDASIHFRPLFRVALAVYARKGHPLSRARSLADLIGADWLDTGNISMPGASAEMLFRSAGLEPPNPIVKCTSYTGAVALLLNNDMLCLTHHHTLGRFPTRDALQVIPVAETMPSVTVGLYTRVGTPLTRVAAAMVRQVVTVSREVGRIS